MNQSHADQVNDRFSKERREFNDKLEQQNRILTQKDREIAVLKNRSEQSVTELEKKNQVLDELK